MITKKDLTSEAYREYDYLNGTAYRITEPQMLYMKEGGTDHRIADEQQILHIMPVNIPHVIRIKFEYAGEIF